MIVQVVFTSEGQEVTKSILCDDDIDCAHLKELACREAFTSPAFTRIYFNGQLLLGDKLVSEFGVVNGSTIKLETASL